MKSQITRKRGAIGVAPDERRCRGLKKDGSRCPNYSIRGRELCSGHALVGVQANSRESERRRILGSRIPEDVAAREEWLDDEDERRAAELREKMKRDLAAHTEMVVRRERERREAAKRPPRELTRREIEDKSIWLKEYRRERLVDSRGQPLPDILEDADGREFRWVVRTRFELVREAEEELIEQIAGPPSRQAPKLSLAEKLHRKREREWAARFHSVPGHNSDQCPICREMRRPPSEDELLERRVRRAIGRQIALENGELDGKVLG